MAKRKIIPYKSVTFYGYNVATIFYQEDQKMEFCQRRITCITCGDYGFHWGKQCAFCMEKENKQKTIKQGEI